MDFNVLNGIPLRSPGLDLSYPQLCSPVIGRGCCLQVSIPQGIKEVLSGQSHAQIALLQSYPPSWAKTSVQSQPYPASWKMASEISCGLEGWGGARQPETK